MSSNITFILMHHRHKLLVLKNKINTYLFVFIYVSTTCVWIHYTRYSIYLTHVVAFLTPSGMHIYYRLP
jgi:hypothetical protein